VRAGGTGTGGVLERMVLPALEGGGYTYRTRVNIGQRLGRGSHFVDVVAEKSDQAILISLKWQQVSGTAEQKVPFEAICLIEVMESARFSKAYIVLGGEGWTLRPFYTSGGLDKYLVGCERVEFITLESFVARANRGAL